MTVTFCGHREVYKRAEVREWLRKCVEMLICEGADLFYLGGYGEFDRMAAGAVREAKSRCPHIRAALVLPYPDRAPDCDGYDYTVYPPLENVPRRYAILRRNEWMVRESDVVAVYVCRGFGGAAAMLEYAVRHGRHILRFSPAG